ncbi:reverse transcriptase domain-containing protein [Tanacetum coccineum]
MSDIKGISPSYCTHKILIEDDYKPVIKPQRRLNPKVQDVVKNEIVKLLDSRLIYPILDSSWVSPIHVVPKKGGMTVVLNDNNELTPSRKVTGWILSNSNRTRRSIKDNIHLSLWDFYLSMNVVWIVQCTGYFSKMHEGNFPRHGGRLYGSIHGRLLEGIVLGHKISEAEIEVDRAKIDVIAKLPFPKNVKGLLMKDAKFDFSDNCKKAFNILKEKLTTAPIIISPDWNVPFELMCDASDFVVRVVLGQRIDWKFKPIYYASKTLNNAQEHYTTTEKELLAVVFSFDKFCLYLFLSKTIVYTDHSALKWAKNLATDHLSRLENPNLGTFADEEIAEKFLDEHLMILKTELNEDEPWYADYVNYIVEKIVPPNWTPEKRRRFFSQVKNYFGDEPYAFKLCPDNIMRRCVAGDEIHEILAHCHSGPTGGHHSASITGRKVYEAGFFWPSIFKDAKDYVMRCDAYQRSGNISLRSKMPQNNIQIEHKAYWALKQCNIDLTAAANNRFKELNELMELRDGAYENTQIYKERTKKWHDSRLRRDKNFKVGDKVLLFNSRFKMHPGKHKLRWYGPNVVKTVYPYGTIEIIDRNRISFKVNGQRLKKYRDEHTDAKDKEVVEFEQEAT